MKKALIGYGGHAREVMAQMGEKIPCFVDDEYSDGVSLPLSSFDPLKFEVMIAIGNSSDRMKMKNKLPGKTKFFSWVHPTALMLGEIVIGEGTFIGAYSILTDNIKIGSHSLLNRGVQIGHDCQIGDFFSAMPSSVVGGNVFIGDCVYLGSCSSVREKIKISDNSYVGMNSGVVKDIDYPGVYVGTPAKKIK